MVEMIDESVGRVVDQLKKDGEFDNTVSNYVLGFVADHHCSDDHIHERQVSRTPDALAIVDSSQWS